MSSFSPSLQPGRHGGQTYDLGQVRLLLGSTAERRALIRYVEALMAQRGFPHPLPSPARRRAGQPLALTDQVTARSHWLAYAVDAWLDNWMPAAAREAISRDAALAAAAEMDGAAAQLGGLRLIAGGRR